jgi:hypothetical protein
MVLLNKLFVFGGKVMQNKKLVISAIALVLVVALFAGIYFATRPAAQQGAKTITVIVVHKDKTEKTFTYHTDEEFLGPVILAEELVVGEEGPYGLMINAVDGETASWDVNQSYWALFVGEEYATSGADTTPINDGDSFKLVYTIG